VLFLLFHNLKLIFFLKKSTKRGKGERAHKAMYICDVMADKRESMGLGIVFSRR
jgi:hypothetical protein